MVVGPAPALPGGVTKGVLMRTLGTRNTFALAGILILVTNPLVASALVGDTIGDHIVGQPDASNRTPNVSGIDASGLHHPAGAAFDAAGNLFVVDAYNNRVLGYRSPATTDQVADLVIGQPDFNSNEYNNGGVTASSLASPFGVAVSTDGDLYVADYSNNRILEYDRPFETDAVADFVIGQPDFTTNVSNEDDVNADTLFNPTSLAIDTAGNLWVADASNNRVLEYNAPVATGDRVADIVIGQLSFTTSLSNNDVVDARLTNGAFAVALDSHRNVWVADVGNNRILGFDDPTRFDTTADRVLGQPSFASEAKNYTGSVDASGLFQPTGASVDANDNVYVCDTFNNRVLVYTAPIATRDRVADRVIGQPDFASNLPNNGGTTARTLDFPTSLAIDRAGNLAIADSNNNRVVLMDAPTPVVTSLQVKVSPTTRKAKLVVRGYGMISGRAVVEVNGVQLSTTKYKEVVGAGDARRLIALDDQFDAIVPPGVPVEVTIVNTLNGGRSAPIRFTR
jgi:sugar lactone lactonase YvrE